MFPTTSTTKPLVLLTGATGHIDFKTLVTAIEAGHTIRAAIRREASIREITSQKAIIPFLGNFTFILVPDITLQGAFDAAVQDVSLILHIASTLANPSPDLEKTIIRPAVVGTLGMLESVQRVVITASIVSVMPLAAWSPGIRSDRKPECPSPGYAWAV